MTLPAYTHKVIEDADSRVAAGVGSVDRPVGQKEAEVDEAVRRRRLADAADVLAYATGGQVLGRHRQQ